MTRDQMVTEICDTLGKARASVSVSGANLEDRVVNYLNWAQRRVAKAFDFDELNVLNTASTLATSKKRYSFSDLGLVRLKDIRSIRLIDSANSWKLERWHYRKYDKKYPRPEQYSTARPRIYVRDGNNLEFFKIPDDNYSLSIRYAQWPQVLASGSQVSDYENKDELLIAGGILEGYLAMEEYADAKLWYERFTGILSDCIKVLRSLDWEPEAEPFRGDPTYSSGEPWLDPFSNPSDPLSSYPD